jgi:serine/threonine protein kinase
MVSPETAASNPFLFIVRKSGVLNENKFREMYEDESDLPTDKLECAAKLVKDGLITQYQANQLLGGKTRGFTLKSYVIQRPLGKGGMGIVYLAEHRDLGRKVAIKVLLNEKANEQINIERFLREARATAALDHPNIVRLHDVGLQGQTHFIVMEYVDGSTLEALLEHGGAMGLSRSVDYISQAAAGLQHAYEKGFIHRDIKPSNLMVTREGIIKILDMGLARCTSEPGDKLTSLMDQGALMGTVDFMSPEQLMSSPNIDIRADIYSLGVTLYTLVTGKPLFKGNTTQKMFQHQIKQPSSLSDIDKTIPPALSAIVDKMIAKKPEDRFQTPAEVIEALAEWLPDAGAARVVAGLSKGDIDSDSIKSTTAKLLNRNTGSKKLPVKGFSKNKPTEVKPFYRNKNVLSVAGGIAATVVLTLLITQFFGSGSSSTVANATEPNNNRGAQSFPKSQPPEGVRQNQPRPQSNPENPPALKSSGISMYTLDLSKQKAFELIGNCEPVEDPLEDRHFVQRTRSGEGEWPTGWRGHTYDPTSDATYSAEVIAGKMAIGTKNVKVGEMPYGTSMLLSPYLKVPADGLLRVKITYLTNSTLQKAVQFKFKPTAPEIKHAYGIYGAEHMQGTGGQWQTIERTIRLDPNSEGYFEFHSLDTDVTGSVYLAEFEISK